MFKRNRHLNCFILFIALLPINKNYDVCSIRINYRYYGGYSPFYCSSLYQFNGDFYELKDCSYITHLLTPKSISLRRVQHLYNKLRINKKQISDVLKLDASNKQYKQFLNNIDYYLERDMLFSNRNEDVYKYKERVKALRRESFEISSEHLHKILIQPEIAIRTPDIEIILTNKNGEEMHIYPYSFYKGTPWWIDFNNSTTLIDYKTIDDFLKKCQLSFIADFAEQDELLYIIALALISEI